MSHIVYNAEDTETCAQLGRKESAVVEYSFTVSPESIRYPEGVKKLTFVGLEYKMMFGTQKFVIPNTVEDLTLEISRVCPFSRFTLPTSLKKLTLGVLCEDTVTFNDVPLSVTTIVNRRNNTVMSKLF